MYIFQNRYILMLLFALPYCLNGLAEPAFESSISVIPQEIQKRMMGTSWKTGCPVPLSELSYVRLSYWGFDNQTHIGTLIVNQTLTYEIIEIFHTLYKAHFPIFQMKPAYLFSDRYDESEYANNTLSFYCRPNTSEPGKYSQHSYGRAIDINPLFNPYHKDNLIIPSVGKKYLDRSITIPGMIKKKEIVVTTFANHGWDWGGEWVSRKDYHHFEKRPRGELAPR